MKKFLILFLSSLIVVSNSLYGQRSQPPGQRGGGVDTPRGERQPRGGKPPRGNRPPGRGQRPGGQRGGGPRPENLTESEAELGSAGIAWYPILKDGLAEAKRTNKPILFMAAASQCGGISGVF
ncbi:hypothetical protein N9117_01355 [Akkermansiaceae bacterium]|nr:hypothetical protein [Akkermansiaceae bacterium]